MRFVRDSTLRYVVVGLVVAVLVCGGGVAVADTIDVPGDYLTIQSAIDAAVDGDEIVIADGTWTGPGNRNLDPGGRSIVIRSAGGASVCIIDCEDLGRAFFIHSGETVRLVGLRIVRGLVEEVGGGAMLVEASNVTAEDCVFGNNRVNGAGNGCCLAENGGAVFLVNAVSVFVRCTFSGNRFDEPPENGFGGAISCDGGSVALTDCTLFQNKATGDCSRAEGGGLAVREAEAILLRCDFSGNMASGGTCGGVGQGFGGGIAVTGATGRLTAIACTFRNNRAQSGDADYGQAKGGGVWVDDLASVLFVNCTFAGNTAEGVLLSGEARGGAFAGAGVLINCTIAGNTSFDAYGETVAGGVSAQGACTLTNCIVWSNGPDAIGGSAIVEYSNVEGGWAGIGNIEADPMFVNDSNLQLLGGSPCIDAGVNNAVPPDVFDLDDDGETTERLPVDLDGNPRFNADELDFDPGCGVPVVVDMGAYECQFDAIEEVLVGDIDGDGVIGFADLLQVLSNWGDCDADCCLADVDFTWEVDFNDLLLVLANWT